jgi:ribosomal protein S18 acetylase RimI-like enzyme
MLNSLFDIQKIYPDIIELIGAICLFIKDDDGKIIGQLEAIPHLSLVSLWIDESHRRKGFGSLLLKQYIEKCKLKNIKEIKFECHKENKPALNLYKKFGFLFEDSEVTEHCYTCKIKL